MALATCVDCGWCTYKPARPEPRDEEQLSTDLASDSRLTPGTVASLSSPRASPVSSGHVDGLEV